MPKDNEKTWLPTDGPLTSAGPSGFHSDEMISCDHCSRANPPTRTSCLYCAEPLPTTEVSQRFRKPSLKQPEKYEAGYNSIFLPRQQNIFSDNVLAAVAELLKLTTENVRRIVSAPMPLPLALTATREDADLIRERLAELGLEIVTLRDTDLGLRNGIISRVRSLQLDENGLTIPAFAGAQVVQILWPKVVLIVPGRLFIKRVEVKQRKSRQRENEILETSEFHDDAAILDLYTLDSLQTWRIAANNFDFSCLQEEKTLIANQNIVRLEKFIISRSANAVVDNSYYSLRQALEPVWPSEQETLSGGWRRERSGKYSLGAATIGSNESQFNRYSRLRFHFIAHSQH